MPRVCVDLLDIDGATQIDQKPTTLGAGAEEEVLGRLIFIRGDLAVDPGRGTGGF